MVRGRVRRGDRGPTIDVISGLFEYSKLIVPDRRSGVGNDLAGHEVVVTGIVRDTNPDVPHRGVVFVSCRHESQNCEACRREQEEREAAERRRADNLRREALKREIVKKYNLASFVVGCPDIHCPRAYAALRSVESVDDPRLPVIAQVAEKYAEWAKVRHQVDKIEEQIRKMQYVPGCESLWKEYCTLGDAKDAHSLRIRALEDKIRDLEDEVKHFHSREAIAGPSKRERVLREWTPKEGGVESIQSLEWDPMAVPRYEMDDEGPWAKSSVTWEPEPGMWKWRTVETRPADPSWVAEKEAEYEELLRRLEEAKAELARMRDDEEYARLKTEFAAVCEKLAAAREAYKASLLGDMPSRAKQLWAEMKALEERLPS